MASSEESLKFLDLPDDQLMLALSVDSTLLVDPAKWCREKRNLTLAVYQGPTTSEEADKLMELAIRLAEESAGKRAQIED